MRRAEPIARAAIRVCVMASLLMNVSLCVFVPSWHDFFVRSLCELAYAVGLKYSTMPAPIEANTKPRYSIGLGAIFGGWTHMV